MENDEKLKSGADMELPVGHEDQTPSESAADNPAGKSGADAGAKLEPNFGMPSFDFFTEPKTESKSFEPRSFEPRSESRGFGEPRPESRGFGEPKLEPINFGEPQVESRTFGDPNVEPLNFGETRSEPKVSAARNSRDLPYNDGTGWQNGSGIERQGSLRARMSAAEDENRFDTSDDLPEISILQPETQSRPQATVMPFPGTTFPRPQEQMASNAILGGREGPEIPEYEASSDDDSDYEGEDQLADAVQSALRNIYGSRSEESWSDDGEDTGVANALIGSDTRVGDVVWSDDNSSIEAYAEDERESAHAEANTEAVLEYLYGNRRVEHVETLTLDTALKDIDPDLVGMQPHYQDDDNYDDRVPSFPSMRGGERDSYRGGGRTPDHRYGEPAVPQQHQHQHQPQEWQQPAYMANLPVRSGPPYVTSAPEPLAPAADSGHLLGAAGLGLIGGIALAGVLAVFVFNSFVDVNDPNMENFGSVKNGDRLQSIGTATAGVQPDTRGVLRSGTVADSSSDGMLSVRGVSGQAGEAIKLAILLTNPARADEALVSIKGLPKEARLSTGIDVGGGQWLLPPARLKNLTVTLPAGSSGSFNLGAQLLKDDAQTSLSDPVYFTLAIGSKTAAAQPAQQPTVTDASQGGGKRVAMTPPTATSQQEEAQPETDFLTQMLIRDGNKAMRDGDITAARRLYEQAAANGSPEAALAMGRSYDPTYFERLNVKNGKPDPATAFEWYKRALDGGLSTARIKIDALKLWLQK